MERRYYPAALTATVLAALLTLYLNSLVAVPKPHPAAEIVRDFSASRYLEHVKYLASDELKGRGFEVRVVVGAGHSIHRDDLAGFFGSLDGWV